MANLRVLCAIFFVSIMLISYTNAAKIKKTQALSTAMLRMKDELDRLAIYGSRKKKPAQQVSNLSKKKKAANRKAAKKARRKNRN